jgi:hypothetical protein
MTSLFKPAVARPARTILLVGVVAAIAGACSSAAALVPPSQPAPSAAPSAGPSVAPSASPSVLHIELIDELTSGATVDVVDQSGTLSGARAAASAERAPDPGAATSADVTVQNVDPTTLWVSWTAGNCPDAHVLTIDATAQSISITQPPFCGGDTIGVGRQLVLSFSRPIDAAAVTATLVQVGR